MNAVVALCHFCEAHGPKIVFCCQPFHEEHEVGENSNSNRNEQTKLFYGKYDNYFHASPSSPPPPAETCNACRSMKNAKPGFLSNDHENRISYVSSQFPYHPEVFTIVRQACVRSLSCEVCPGREGPIFFGDDQYGYCLCYPFTLKDSQARGFQRWYSYCIVSVDKLLLLNFYDLLSSSLKLLVEFLQVASKRVFDDEQAKRGGENLPQIAASGRLGWLPLGFMRERAGSSSSGVARTLTELAGDPQVFGKLHKYFVWLLQLPSNCVVEQVLEGLPSQDDLVRLETTPEDQGVDYSNGHAGSGSSEEDEKSKKNSLMDSVLYQSTRDKCVSDLRAMFQIFGVEAFKILAFHVTVGNQVIVKSQSSKVAESVLTALATLLPAGCCRLVKYSQVYVPHYRCNFLGLPAEAPLPSAADDGDQFVVIVAKCCSSDADVLDTCNFRLHYVGAPPIDYPTLIDRAITILSDNRLSVRSIDQCLSVLKDEWLNKSKLLFQLTKQTHLDSGRRRECLLKMSKLNKDVDELVVKFWQAGLSRQYKKFVLSRIQSTNSNHHGTNSNGTQLGGRKHL